MSVRSWRLKSSTTRAAAKGKAGVLRQSRLAEIRANMQCLALCNSRSIAPYKANGFHSINRKAKLRHLSHEPYVQTFAVRCSCFVWFILPSSKTILLLITRPNFLRSNLLFHAANAKRPLAYNRSVCIYPAGQCDFFWFGSNLGLLRITFIRHRTASC